MAKEREATEELLAEREATEKVVEDARPASPSMGESLRWQVQVFRPCLILERLKARPMLHVAPP